MGSGGHHTWHQEVRRMLFGKKKDESFEFKPGPMVSGGPGAMTQMTATQVAEMQRLANIAFNQSVNYQTNLAMANQFAQASAQQAAMQQVNYNSMAQALGGAGLGFLRDPARPEYRLTRKSREWTVCYGSCSYKWTRKPSRQEIAAKIREFRAARPTKVHADTLGWRSWVWDGRRLRSPQQTTVWETGELRASVWHEDEVVRGVAGIHALRLPMNWRLAEWSEHYAHENVIHGVIERFGRFILGTEGWRAEHVVIRELMAPTPEIMTGLMMAYPDAQVHLSHRYVAEEV